MSCTFPPLNGVFASEAKAKLLLQGALGLLNGVANLSMRSKYLSSVQGTVQGTRIANAQNKRKENATLTETRPCEQGKLAY
eukprot:1156769-Pelagomonas_calceolata.AAC.4